MSQERVYSLRDIFAILMDRKLWLISSFIIFTMLAFFYAAGRERIYSANTSIYIDPRGIQVLDRDVTPRNETTDGGIAIVESQMRVMTSASVLVPVIDALKLHEDAEFIEGPKGAVADFRRLIRQALQPSRGKKAAAERLALDKLQEAVRVSRPQLSYIAQLFVRSRDPEKAARIAAQIAETYVNLEIGERSLVARRASTALASRLEELRNQLTNAEDAVERYKLENNILNTNGSLVNEQELTQLNGQLLAARGTTAELQSKLEQIRLINQANTVPQTLPEAVQSQTISQLRVQHAIASQRVINLESRLFPDNPRLIAAKEQVEEVTRAITAELRRIAAAAQVEYDTALANEKKLEQRLETLRQTAFITNDALVKLRELQRDAEAKRAIYENFLVRSKELSEQEQVDTTRARIISSASVPLEPDDLASSLILLIGMAAGTIFGVAGALFSAAVSTVPPAIPALKETAQPVSPPPPPPSPPVREKLPQEPVEEAPPRKRWWQRRTKPIAAPPANAVSEKSSQPEPEPEAKPEPVAAVPGVDKAVSRAIAAHAVQPEPAPPSPPPSMPVAPPMPAAPPIPVAPCPPEVVKEAAPPPMATRQEMPNLPPPAIELQRLSSFDPASLPILSALNLSSISLDTLGLLTFVLERPMAPASQAMRLLLAHLRINRFHESGHVLLVTGLQPESGKATIALNLAIAATQAGMKALVVDVDFQDRSVSRLRANSPELGLTRLAKKQGADINDWLVKDPSGRFQILPAGEGRIGDGRKFDRLRLALQDRLGKLVNDTETDLIVLVGETLGTSGRGAAFAGLADSILVAALDKQEYNSQLQMALDELAAFRHRVIGAVLVSG